MALLILQTLHSAIFVCSVVFTVWLWVCLLTGRGGRWCWVGVFWLGAIGVSLFINGGVCPLQDVARWIEGTDEYVQDMLTPEWFNDLAVPMIAPPSVIAIAGLAMREALRLSRSRRDP